MIARLLLAHIAEFKLAIDVLCLDSCLSGDPAAAAA
jgi:hypothetical protein